VIMCVEQELYHIGGISSIAVAVPSIGMGVATFIGGRLYDETEREAGKASFLMGTVGITEGAIPFAAADPLRVLPSIMIGTAIGAVTAALLGVGSKVAWGGLIVLPVSINAIGFVVALAVGAVATALLVNTLKSVTSKPVAEEKQDDGDINLDIQIAE